MFVRIWQFRVRPEKIADFRAAYGANGNWVQLFHRVAGYLGTDLLQSAAEPNTFVTFDRWESAEAWAAFLRAWGEDYAALDHRCEGLAWEEVEWGAFESHTSSRVIPPGPEPPLPVIR
jgi:heme-degrading monooxygenase HmoA